jgi:DNA-binding IclR family transcriptional regulator
MHAATGHVILAHQTQDARVRVIQSWTERNNTVAPRHLTSHLAAIKERGFEEKESYQVNGFVNVTYTVVDENR